MLFQYLTCYSLFLTLNALRREPATLLNHVRLKVSQTYSGPRR